MELAENPDVVWQISLKVNLTGLHLGFAEGFVCLGDQVRLIEPFTRMPLHTGPGIVLCRGPWSQGRILPLKLHALQPCPREAWMQLDAADLIRVHDFLATLQIDVAPDGFRRPDDL